MLRLPFTLTAIAILVFLTACSSGDTPPTSPAEPAEPVAPAEPSEPAKDILYTWVDGLNVRDQPSTKGNTVARVKPNEPLTFTGEQSPKAETIVLRGVAYHEPWLKITTADRKDGWVYGGAVKLKDQLKGNASLSPNRCWHWRRFGK